MRGKQVWWEERKAKKNFEKVPSENTVKSNYTRGLNVKIEDIRSPLQGEMMKLGLPAGLGDSALVK